MKISLLIMAAGIGSRYGSGIKQLVTVDRNSHIIMDYSIHDAIAAGFNKIIFVIRKDIESEFKNIIGERIEKICEKYNIEVCYAFQDIADIPKGYNLPHERIKPWGTGHAVLSAKEYINEPFVVINADDYYGINCYKKMRDYLINNSDCKTKFCMAGFILRNTLSKTGGVTRGICEVDNNNYLTNIIETPNIKMEIDEFGSIIAKSEDSILSLDNYVSMNMWGFTPEFLSMLENGFISFFENDVKNNPLKAEYLLPTFVGKLLKENMVQVKVLQTSDEWFGITYESDKALVQQKFESFIFDGIYNEDLFGDL